MAQKIVCKSREYSLELDCQKVERNLYKVLNLLSKIDMLYTISDNPLRKTADSEQKYPPPPPPKRRKSKQLKLKEAILNRKDIKYAINNQTAQQIVWRSAYLANNLGIANEQIRGLHSDRLVGQKNDLDEIIVTLGGKLKNIKENPENSQELNAAKKKLIKLAELRDQVQKNWGTLKYQQPNDNRSLFSPPLTLFNEEMYDEQKRRIILQIKKYLLFLDLKMLKHSIMFIQELETGHCIVTLEQSYPSFMVFKELFKRIVGPFHYFRGLRQLLLAKERCYRAGLMFKGSRFRMCHICEQIHFQQEQGYQCQISEKVQSITDTPYGYQQIVLFSNYAYINQVQIQKIERQNLVNKSTKFLNRKFITYKHPYSQIFNQKCNRYYSTSCHPASQKDKEQNEQKIKLKKGQAFSHTIAKKIKQLQNCPFCRLQCNCERCSTMNIFNRVMALYQSVGGNFEDLLNDLVFLNLESQQIFIQYVEFENNEGQFEFQEGKKIEINQTELDSLPLADQIARLEQSLLNADDMEEESVDSNQIFPNIQKMFDDLMLQERRNNDQGQEMKGQNQEAGEMEKGAE